MTHRCVLYARLSVTKEESVSIARQLESTRKYAEGRGWEVVGEFVDDGVSATANRPEDRLGWRALLATPGFDAVVIWKVDRLARRVLDFLHVDETLQRRGAGLVAVEDPIDMTTPMGRAFATILAVFGEMEAAAISSRVKAARNHLLKEGRYVGGGIPYGFTTVPNPDGAGWILGHDLERIGWLRTIVGMAIEGQPVSAITRHLDHALAPLPAGRVRKTGNQGWNRQTVDGILRNPILAGMTPRNPGRKKGAKRADPFAVLRDEVGEPVVDESLAIITIDEFRALISTLDARSTPQARSFAERRRTCPLLSKVAHCDDCDRYMCRGTNQGKATLYCPQCRQTIGREGLDPFLAQQLLTERGDEPYASSTVSDWWHNSWNDPAARRSVLLSQVDSIRIRRGVVGRRFDADRVIIRWAPASVEAVAS